MEFTEEDYKLVHAAMKDATKGFTSIPRGYDREDLIQEGALVVWQAFEKGRYNKDKGAKSTFIYKVIKDRYFDLIKSANRDKRKIEQHTLSYDDQVTVAAIESGGGKKDPRVSLKQDYEGFNKED
jgi:DNA-directed RNA polymerase specialized sigma24 family protein